jgi:hypothetical protein
LFFHPAGEPVIGKAGTPAPGLDPHRGRLTVTVPPSIHLATRKPYPWVAPPWEIARPPAPSWLLRLVAPPPEPPPPAPPRMVHSGREGAHTPSAHCDGPSGVAERGIWPPPHEPRTWHRQLDCTPELHRLCARVTERLGALAQQAAITALINLRSARHKPRDWL